MAGPAQKLKVVIIYYLLLISLFNATGLIVECNVGLTDLFACGKKQNERISARFVWVLLFFILG
jgi:hypothetical protein